MRWSVQQLLAKRQTGLQIDKDVQVTDLKQRDSNIRDISPAHVTGEATFQEKEVVTFHLRITGEMTLPCSRTLLDVRFPFDIETVERFRLDGLPADEADIHMHELDQGYVDLIPYVKENILLEIPMQIFAENVEGKDPIAPQEGNGWKVVHHEEEEKDTLDPRMAELAKFFDKSNET
ncbi:YceD family protein [Aliibacillus thermotolerans]|uniref:YceD family protein n=1 Tax=Aliibacillus thermotolerans TaxID=1834418 RepID=A0ABW0U234_9BACI|nr:YceD family protein [Aliibacillus thermotolerans]MDA3131018.1 DUF177 domain-containing protein [Aliibacillus thermotolerans]